MQGVPFCWPLKSIWSGHQHFSGLFILRKLYSVLGTHCCHRPPLLPSDSCVSPRLTSAPLCVCSNAPVFFASSTNLFQETIAAITFGFSGVSVAPCAIPITPLGVGVFPQVTCSSQQSLQLGVQQKIVCKLLYSILAAGCITFFPGEPDSKDKVTTSLERELRYIAGMHYMHSSTQHHS